MFLICGQENRPPPVCVEKGGPWVEDLYTCSVISKTHNKWPLLSLSLYDKGRPLDDSQSGPTKPPNNQPTTVAAQPWALMKPHHTTVGDKCTRDREQATSFDSYFNKTVLLTMFHASWSQNSDIHNAFSAIGKSTNMYSVWEWMAVRGYHLSSAEIFSRENYDCVRRSVYCMNILIRDM